MDILLAVKDCQNFKASYDPYMGHDYPILCHRNRLESGEPTIFGKLQDYLKLKSPKIPAEFLVYRKVVASILLSDFEAGLHPNQIIQALAELHHCHL